jgi:hypothetical protein
MARLRLEQILSNMRYDRNKNELHITGSSFNALVVSGSVLITSGSSTAGTLTITGVDSWGDSGSFDVVDLGDNQF